MKFKTNCTKVPIHKGTVNCLGWSNNEEVYSVSDNHQIYKWNVKTRDPISVAKLPEDFYPTDLDWLIVARQRTGLSKAATTSGSGGGSGSNSSSDALLISSSDGRFIILNKNARVERSIAAHATVPITAGRWSPDGAGLLTAAEDGVIKIWSRSGMLRSAVVNNEGIIRCAVWSATSAAIAYCQAGFIAIKPLSANSKLIKWSAHEGLALCLAWSSDSQFLVSGGEDCRYKVWDNNGTIIYAGSTEEYAITSVAFCPDSQLLAIGSFNSLKLCNFSGWIYSTTKFTNQTVGSLFTISWSNDGTQIVSGTATGALVFGYVIEQEMISQHLKAATTGRKTIEIQDLNNKTADTLDFPERIIKWHLGYDHLVVATINQIHIYNRKYINTPLSVIDGRSDVRLIILGKKYFLIMDNAALWVYTYTGRLHLNPKYPGLQSQLVHLNERLISLGLHYLAIRDCTDQCIIRMFDLVPGATRQNEPILIQSKVNITEVKISRAGNQDDQYIVYIDTNRDLYCSSIVLGGVNAEIFKIGTQIITCMWGSESNILVGLHDSCYSIWYCPGEACNDPTIIALTTITLDTTEMGKNVSLDNFEGSLITFKSAGALFTVQSNLFCNVLHRLLADDQWLQALQICRRCQNITVWAMLAAIASKRNQLDICEEAYSAALQIDKVEYLQHIKNLSSSSSLQMAENSIMMGRMMEIETILLHNKKIPEVIELLMRLHQWDRALDIAEQHHADVEQILVERKKYLAALQKNEYNHKFLKYIDKIKLI